MIALSSSTGLILALFCFDGMKYHTVGVTLVVAFSTGLYNYLFGFPDLLRPPAVSSYPYNTQENISRYEARQATSRNVLRIFSVSSFIVVVFFSLDFKISAHSICTGYSIPWFLRCF